MSRLVIAFAAIAVSACASTSSWQDLRIDASSPTSFQDSVDAIEEALPYHRGQLFLLALQDIQMTGLAADDAFAPKDYLGQLDGLGYDEVLALADATGPTTMQRYTFGARVGVPEAGERAFDRLHDLRGLQSLQPTTFPPGAKTNPFSSTNPYEFNSPYPLNHP